MKYPYTGLYTFCKELGSALVKSNKGYDTKISFYLPEKERGVFGADQEYLIQNPIHKFFPKKVHMHDIWHCTYQRSGYIPLAKEKLKFISTIHDLNYLHQGKSQNKQTLYLQKIQRLLDKSHTIVAISYFVKNQLLDHLKVEEKKIEVIYNGRNIPPYLNFKKPQIIKDKPFFFSIGTLTTKKNFHVLPAMLLNNDYELVIAGITQSQDYRTKILNEAKALGVADRVKLIGPVNESEKYWLFKNCVAFCFPSLAEGFGLPVIEAMQFGTPVILSKATSLPEIGGPHAYYFDELDPQSVNNTVTNFLNVHFDHSKKLELINWAAQFNWDVAAKKYLDLYASI